MCTPGTASPASGVSPGAAAVRHLRLALPATSRICSRTLPRQPRARPRAGGGRRGAGGPSGGGRSRGAAGGKLKPSHGGAARPRPLTAPPVRARARPANRSPPSPGPRRPLAPPGGRGSARQSLPYGGGQLLVPPGLLPSLLSAAVPAMVTPSHSLRSAHPFAS